jgi:hypothetical protein
MKRNATRNNLLLYAYNETGLLTSDAVQRAIDGDPLVADDYTEMLGTLATLDKFKATPSESSIQKILAFAKKTS